MGADIVAVRLAASLSHVVRNFYLESVSDPP